ncbi:MAG: class I SAM-dependent methyltransferase [Planctomycetes bacterium]|nr:class I SAM-dependent methyltransferase [Planctomycetota bacterium]
MLPNEGLHDYSVAAEFYDGVKAYEERPDVQFFVDAAAAAGGPVLEVGCGTGRVLLPCARAGARMTGLDLSDGMLKVLHAKLEKEPAEVRARVNIVKGDMRAFELNERFSLATIPFRPFQHLLTVPEQRACLQSIRKHLLPGGRLILDVYDPNLKLLLDERRKQESGVEACFDLPGGRKVERRFRVAAVHFCRQVQDVELIYYVTHSDGTQERIVDAFPMRYFFRYEMQNLLESEGFVIEALYGDYKRTPRDAMPGDALCELVFMAKKEG